MLDRLMLDASLYRDAMSRYAGHVQIVTTAHEGEKRGVTITAACSISDNPAMVLACVNASNEKNAIFSKSGNFALKGVQDGLEAEYRQAFAPLMKKNRTP